MGKKELPIKWEEWGLSPKTRYETDSQLLQAPLAPLNSVQMQKQQKIISGLSDDKKPGNIFGLQ